MGRILATAEAVKRVGELGDGELGDPGEFGVGHESDSEPSASIILTRFCLGSTGPEDSAELHWLLSSSASSSLSRSRERLCLGLRLTDGGLKE